MTGSRPFAGGQAMSYAPRPSEFRPCRESQAADGPGQAGPGLLRRIYDAIFQSRAKQAERVVAAYLERTGGRFTDAIERQLTDRLISGDWRR